MAADIDQKPPMTMPSSARPAMNTTTLFAIATIIPDAIISATSQSSTRRRSMPRVADEIMRLVTTAKKPETAMA